MFSLKSLAAEVGACGLPTPLLRHLAPEQAEAIARLWPAPHRPFLETGAERRHLVCLALCVREAFDLTLARRALMGPLKREVAALVPDAPEGLARALGRLGEVAWPAEAYRQLLALLRQPRTATLLRHAAEISEADVRGLGVLTDRLHAAGLGPARLTEAQAGVLDELYRALERRDGPEAAAAAARRWAAGRDIRDIFGRAVASMRRPMSPPPFEGDAQLRPVRTLGALEEIAGRMSNCAGALDYAGDANIAWLEWRGEPGALIQLTNDRLYGWTLAEARIARNAAVPAEARAAITHALREIGVHVGYNADDLDRALDQAGVGRAPCPAEQTVAWRYGD